MIDVTATVDSANVERRLRQIEDRILNDLPEIGKEAMKPVFDTSRQLVPKVSGELDLSLRLESVGRDRTILTSNKPYARRIENGYSGVDAAGRTYNQSGKAYMRRSLDQNHAEVRQAGKKAIQARLR